MYGAETHVLSAASSGGGPNNPAGDIGDIPRSSFWLGLVD
jgi:hypothetical protein